MKKEDLAEWLKIKSKAWLTIVIDRIVDWGIYTSAWNAWLKNRNRIFWSNYDIDNLLSNWWFKYIDERIKITIKEFYKKFPSYKDYYIEWHIPKAKWIQEIWDDTNKVWDMIYDKHIPKMYRTINKIIKEDDKIVWYELTTYQTDKPSADLSFYLSLKDMKDLYSYEKTNKILSKYDVAILYNLESEKDLVIND